MGFQKMYGLRGPCTSLTAVLQLIYEIRKNWRGWTGIEGSTRGPRGPKKHIDTSLCNQRCNY